MIKSRNAKVFVFDLCHVYDRLIGLELELNEIEKYLGYYLESRFAKTGYLVIKTSYPFQMLTNPYFRFIEDKLNACRLMSLFNPTNIPSQQRAAECHLVVRDYSLLVVFP